MWRLLVPLKASLRIHARCLNYVRSRLKVKSSTLTYVISILCEAVRRLEVVIDERQKEDESFGKS
jgi:hypothetical protein